MASWDVSALYRHTASAIVPAATGQRGRDRIVSCHRERVVLRDLESLQVVRAWTLPIAASTAADADSNSAAAAAAAGAGGAAVTTFSVSPTAPHYILAFVKKSNAAWVLDPDQDGEKARIDVGAEGAVAMDWAHALEPTVMCWSAHHLRLSLFPIADTTVAKPPAFHILSPKFSPSSSSLGTPYAGHSFHPDGTFLVSLERSRPSSSTGSASSAAASNPSNLSHYDLISIYSTRTSEAERALVKSFPLPVPPAQAAQVDLAGVKWSPCGRYIAAWTSATDYRVFVMSPLGHLLGSFAPYAEIVSEAPSASTTGKRPTASTAGRVSRINGKPPAKLPNVTATPPAARQSEHERSRGERSTGSFVGLGIRTVEWHPSGEYLAIGGWDGKMRILTRFGWVAIAELGLPAPSPGGAKIAAPVVVWREPLQWVEKTRGRGIVSFERPNLPYPLPTPLAVDLTRPNPRMGVEKLVFSPSGAWCAVLNPGYPTVLALYALPLPTAASASAAMGTSTTAPDDQQRTQKTSRPLGRSRLHTILLFTPDMATPDTATSPAGDGRIREFRWQPKPQAVGDDDLDYGEETFAADEPEIAEDGSETLVVVSGQKGFATWRSPRVGLDGEVDHGLAECVGIPTQTDFASAGLSFATSSRSSPNAPLVVSSSPVSAGNTEATFCVAYPVSATSGAD